MARIDLPLGVALSGRPIGGRVAALVDANAAPVEATLLGVAPDTDPTTQGRGFLLLIAHHPNKAGDVSGDWRGEFDVFVKVSADPGSRRTTRACSSATKAPSSR